MHLTKGKNIKKKNCKIKIMAKAITSSLELQEKNLENKNIAPTTLHKGHALLINIQVPPINRLKTISSLYIVSIPTNNSTMGLRHASMLSNNSYK